MKQCNKCEEYLEKVKEQIKNKEVKNSVAEEIEQHILDQKYVYIAEGAEEEEAERRAVADMGDPVDTGLMLNKIHRPKMEWGILANLFLLIFCGMITLYVFSVSLWQEDLPYLSTMLTRQAVGILIGSCLLIGLYFMNYNVLEKYSLIILAAGSVAIIICRKLEAGLVVNGTYTILYPAILLFLPIFAGCVYSFRGQGGKGIIKSLVICFVLSIIARAEIPSAEAFFEISVSGLIIITVAIAKGCFGKKKKIKIGAVWMVSFAFESIFILYQASHAEYIRARLMAVFQAENNDYVYTLTRVREYLQNSRVIGSIQEGGNIDGYLPNIPSDYMLTYIIARFGLIAGAAVILLICMLIGRMFYLSIKQKNLLGCLIGVAGTCALGAQSFFYILSNLGINTVMASNVLPFLSYGEKAMIVNLCIAGILLSVFRRTNMPTIQLERRPRLILPQNQKG